MIFLSSHVAHRMFAFGIIGVFFTALFILNPSFLAAPKTEAAINDLSGFAWSDNIGWISFSSTSDGSVSAYSVKIDTATGAISGSAWSENIGWISFDRSATNNPPSAPFNGGSGAIASIDWATGKVTGWARALAGCENTPGVPVTSCGGSGAGAASGGWDGWIRLSDDANANWVNKGVSINVSTGKFSGYAWGDEVMGWIDFAPTTGGVSILVSSCTPPLDPTGVCTGGQVCSASGVCIPPNGSCSTNFDCGGGQSCNTNGKCVYSDGVCSTSADCVGGQSCVGGICTTATACTVPADCPSGVCDLVTHTCAISGGSGCGDSICGSGETLRGCPQDCKGRVQQF